MNWGNVKDSLSKAAPLLGLIMGGPAAPIIGGMVAKVLGVDPEPDKIEAALKTASPETLARIREIEITKKAEIEKLAIEQGIVLIKAEAARIESVNATMRVEAQSEDKWTRRWRPFWGFSSCIAFFMICAAIAWSIFSGDSVVLKELGSIVTAIAILFSIPGAILGVASWHRGQKQRVQAGEVKGPGLIKTLVGGLARGGS